MPGKVIGRVAIKVVPDTSNFRDDAAGDLRRIRKELKDVKVKVVPEIDKDSVQKLKARMVEIGKRLKTTVNIGVNLLDRDVAAEQAKLSALTNGRTVNLGVAMKDRDLALQEAKLAGLTRHRKVMISPELKNSAVAKVASGLAALGGLRYTRKLFSEFREELERIDKLTPKIGVLSHVFGTLGAYVFGVSGNLFSLSSSLAQMGQAALAIPGILGGIVIGLVTTITAFRDFNKYVPQAKGYLSDLRAIVSQNFWAVAAANINSFVNALFTILKPALASTSTALGGFFASFASSAKNIILPGLPGMFSNLTASIGIATGATDAYAGIIEKLGTVGASYLPRLAQFVADISTQFDNFLGRSPLTLWIDQGIQAIKDFSSATASLFSIFSSLGKAAEAAGGTTLSTLARDLGAMAQAAKDPAFQGGLTASLAAVYAMFAQIKSIAGPAVSDLFKAIGEGFQRFGPTMGDTVGTAIKAIASVLANPSFQDGIDSMLTGFNNMVHSLAPLADFVGAKMGAMGALIGAIATNIGLVMAQLGAVLKPIFVSLVEAALPFINMLGPQITKALGYLSPVFEQLAGILRKAMGALGPLIAAFFSLVDVLAPILIPVLKIVISILGDALMGIIKGVTLIFRGLVQIITGVVTVFKGLWDVIAGLFTLDFSRVGEGFKTIFSGLGQIILGALKTAWGAVLVYLNGTVFGFVRSWGAKLLLKFAGPFLKFLTPIQKAAGEVLAFLKTVFGKIAGIFKGAGGEAATSFLLAPFKAYILILKTIFGVIKTVVLTIRDVLWTSFAAVTDVLKVGFTAALDVVKVTFMAVRDASAAVWNAILTTIKVVVGAIRTALVAFGEAFMVVFNAVKAWVLEFITYLQLTIIEPIFVIASKVGEAFVAMRTAISGALDLIKGKVSEIWSAISSTITSTLGAIKTKISDAWTYARVIVSTALDSIKSKVSTIWTYVRVITSEVFDAVKGKVSSIWNAIKGTISSALDAVKGVVSGAWNAVKGTTSAALDLIKGVVSGAWNSVKGTTQAAWDLIKGAVSKGVGDVVSKVREIPGKAVSAVSAVGTTLYNAGSDLIRGFIRGIGDMFDGVRTKLGELTSKLTSWKGPESLDRVLLTPVGHLIIQSLIDGFEDKFAAVRSMLRSLTQEIAGFIDTSMSKEISDSLSFAATGTVSATSAGLSGLGNTISVASKAAGAAAAAPKASNVQIDNITIPLEDLAQLQDLEDFLDLLRVRIRQGAS